MSRLLDPYQNGNILTATKNGETYHTYGYTNAGCSDLLTSFDGEAITYDAIGNPLTYRGSTLEWKNGRRLAKYTNTAYTIQYEYTTDGIRTAKTVNGQKTTYLLQGDTMIQERRANGDVIGYAHDATGKPVGFEYYDNAAGTMTYCYYRHNLQGDITDLCDRRGNSLVHYTYDAWGKLISITGEKASTLGVINPLRYRGYYYDSETGLYYLQSRYYDPEVGRFISADGYVSTGQGVLGSNMFAYCGNNPVSRMDSEGQFWLGAILITLFVAGCATGLSGCSSKTTSAPRSDLSKAPKLNVSTAPPTTYNCYGNGIGKQIRTNPTGYRPGDSTAKTFEAVKKDLGGSKNVRKLKSVDSPLESGEFKVAMKCGPSDYHFIRLDDVGWYNKSGTMPGLYVNQEVVTSDIWYGMWDNNGKVRVSRFTFYDDETIYFAVKVGWDEQ